MAVKNTPDMLRGVDLTAKAGQSGQSPACALAGMISVARRHYAGENARWPGPTVSRQIEGAPLAFVT